MEFFLIFVITSHFSFASRQVFDYGVPFDTANCSLSSSLLSEISEYKSIAKAIYREITEGSSRNETYMELAQFVETFGARLSGSTSLENSLAYMEEKLQSLGLENVHSEQASVYKLERYSSISVSERRLFKRRTSLKFGFTARICAWCSLYEVCFLFNKKGIPLTVI